MRVAIVLVHYHTPQLVAGAVEALCRDAAASGLELELVVVDNGSDEAGRAVLRQLPAKLISPERNTGYSGGVNRGVAATSADIVVLMNPDVEVLAGCCIELLRQLQVRPGIAGPRFFWDRAQSVLLPPAERRTRIDALWRLAAPRGALRQSLARRRWRAHARRHWLAVTPLPSYALSGSLLAVTRRSWNEVGPFDEGYPLYFEETDWLERARRRGVAAAYVPAARALHLHGESARREPRAQEWFEASARRFRRRHYGVWFESLQRRLAIPPPATSDATAPGIAGTPAEVRAIDLSPWRGERELWIELSPSAQGFPAAAQRLVAPLPTSWALPKELLERSAGARLHARVVNRVGEELGPQMRMAALPA